MYRPRDAEHTVLHQVIAEHLEAFLGGGRGRRRRGFSARIAGASTSYGFRAKDAPAVNPSIPFAPLYGLRAQISIAP